MPLEAKMKHKKLGIALSIGSVVLAAAVTWAADNPEIKAERIRDRAISKLAAWQTKSADNILNKEHKYDKTQPWLTAEALYLATTGIGNDEEALKRSVELLDKQAKRTPKDPVSEFYLGEALVWTGKTDEAKIAWGRTRDRAKARIESDPKDAEAQFYLGAALVRLRQPDQARKVLKKIDVDAFDPAMVEFQIGMTYMLQEKWNAAKDSFDKVAEANPRYAHLYFYRAIAWDKLGRKDNLLIDLDQFVKLAPNSPDAKTAKAILSSMK